jgi:hypothetical protein
MELAEPFREVVELYTEASGSDALDRGELIGNLLDYEWGVFSEELVDMRQELAVAILTADLHGKELYDYPNYEGLFFSNELSLEETWDTRAYAALKGEIPKPPDPEIMGEQRELLGQFEIAFEDLAELFEPNKQGSLYRARLYDDRHRKEKYTAAEVGGPTPPTCLTPNMPPSACARSKQTSTGCRNCDNATNP